MFELYTIQYGRSAGRQDWRDLVNYDYDSEYSCEESGCNNEGICRCGRIRGVTVDTSFEGCVRLFQNAHKDKFGLEPALNFWFIRRMFPEVSFDFEAEGDYYGEVLGRIYPTDDSFQEKAEKFSAMTSSEKINYMLTQEYGHVLPDIKKVTEWEMKPVFISEVLQTPNNRISTEQVDRYKHICQLAVNSPETRKKFQEVVQFLAPLCLKRDKAYQVIDGTHRTIALTSTYQINNYGKKKKKDEFVPLFMWIICPKESK